MRQVRLGLQDAESRIVGRCMSKEEYKTLEETSTLGYKDDKLVPVFDAYPAIIDVIYKMKRSKRGKYFRRIGVRSTEIVSLMKVEGKCVEGPRQSNGLRELVYEAGTPVEIVEKINC